MQECRDWAWSPVIPGAPRFTLRGWPAQALAAARHFLGAEATARPPEGTTAVVCWRVPKGESGHPPSSSGFLWRPRGEVAALAGKVSVEVDASGNAAVVVAAADDGELLRQVIWRVLPAVLGELALAQGWLLLHAAAVGLKGSALVFPGPGGVGKTTIATAAAAAGWPVLADDLVWLRPVSDGPPPVVGLPRGGWPTPGSGLFAGALPALAVVFPALGGVGERQVRRLAARLVVRELWGAWVGLGAPGTAAARLTALSQVAERVPGFVWVRPRWPGR